MPYELLNTAQVTPHRLLAVLRLVAERENLTYDEVRDLVQPPDLVDSQHAADSVLDAGRLCGLIEEDSARTVRLLIPPQSVETPAAFRAFMQTRVLGVTDDLRPNYLFNLFSAWYIVQNAHVLAYTRSDFEMQFNAQMSVPDADRQFNTTKYSGWRQWAAFLGLGWLFRLPSARAEVLMPDPSARLLPILPRLLGEGGEMAPFGMFARRLADQCPELDGGTLFERCWSSCNPGVLRSNQLSLALSSALRVLHARGVLRLEEQADARENWRLAQAHGTVNAITHIGWGGNHVAATDL